MAAAACWRHWGLRNKQDQGSRWVTSLWSEDCYHRILEEAKLRSTKAAARKTICEEGENYWTKVVKALDKDNDGKVFVGEYQKLPTRRKRGIIELPNLNHMCKYTMNIKHCQSRYLLLSLYISVNELFQDWIMQMQKRRKRRVLKATTSIKIFTLTKRNSLGNWRLNQSLDIVLFAKQEKSKKKWMKVLWINAEHAFITCKHFLSDHGDGRPVQLLPHLRGPAPPWRLLPVLAAPPPPAETRPLTGIAGNEPSQSLKFHNHWEGYWRGIFRDCGNFVDLGFRRGRWCAGARAWRGCRPGARAAASQS